MGGRVGGCRGAEDAGYEGDRSQVGPGYVGERETAEATGERRAVGDVHLESAAALADQVVPDVAGGFGDAAGFGHLAGALDRAACDPQLRFAARLRELFHRLAVAVATEEIHAGVDPGRILLEDAFDEAHRFEVLAPVQRRAEPEAGDDVGHRDLSRCLSAVLGADGVLGAHLLRVEAGIDGNAQAGQMDSVLAQPLEQLHDEGGVFDRRQWREHARRRGVDSRQVRVRGPACGATGERRVRESAQILDQRQPQHARPRPQLADGQRCDRLEAVDEANELGTVQTAVAVADELERECVDARGAGELTCGELGQLEVVVPREVLAYVSDLGRDEVEVVENPLRGGRDELAAVDVAGERAIGGRERACIVLESRPAAPRRTAGRGIDGEARGERLGALLEELDAEQLLAERRFRRRRPRAENPAEDGNVRRRQWWLRSDRRRESEGFSNCARRADSDGGAEALRGGRASDTPGSAVKRHHTPATGPRPRFSGGWSRPEPE